MNRNAALGRQGEQMAFEYLVDQGLIVLDRNWRCRYGELDLVARDGSTLVVCEVKTRSSLAFGHPAEAISARKLRRLRHLAYCWLMDHEVHAPQVRIDIVCILPSALDGPQIEHLKDVCAS